MEAEYNGLWGPPSEEDSAIPHVGAIPWDTEDPNQVIPAVLQAIGELEDSDIEILAPDDMYYVQENRNRTVSVPSIYCDAQEGWVKTTEGYLLVPATFSPVSSGAPCHPSGAYRQIRSKTEARAVGARGQFWVPPESGTYGGVYVNEAQNATTRDAPHIYFGISYRIGRREYDIEGGIYYMPGRWGVYDPSVTVSIAQKVDGQSGETFLPTGSYFGLQSNGFPFYQHVPVGIGHMPVVLGMDLNPVQLLRHNIGWVDWTSALTSITLSCPPPPPTRIGFDHFVGREWYRGHEWIDLR